MAVPWGGAVVEIMMRIVRAMSIGVLIQVGTFIFFVVTAPFLGYFGLLLMPGLLFITPEPSGAAHRAILFWVGIVVDILFYALVIYGFSWWAERRRESSPPPSISP